MNTHKRSTTRDKERYFITIKGFAQCEGLVILIMNASNKASKKQELTQEVQNQNSTNSFTC